MNRRDLLTGIGALLCAPAIVRATSIMPVKPYFDLSEITFKATERFLRGAYGTVHVAVNGIDGIVSYVGASERIYMGDVVVLDGGYVRPINIREIVHGDANVVFGVAMASSKDKPSWS